MFSNFARRRHPLSSAVRLARLGGCPVVIALYRDEEDCAVVRFGSTVIAVAKWRYEENKHYKTPFSALPTKAEYDARQKQAAE